MLQAGRVAVPKVVASASASAFMASGVASKAQPMSSRARAASRRSAVVTQAKVRPCSADQNLILTSSAAAAGNAAPVRRNSGAPGGGWSWGSRRPGTPTSVSLQYMGTSSDPCMLNVARHACTLRRLATACLSSWWRPPPIPSCAS